MAKRWYIVHAYTNFERKVAEQIRERAKQANLDHLFEDIVVPTEDVVEIRRGRKIQSERKFLPGYVLVRMEMTDAAFLLIKNTPKVTGFLGSDNKAIPISDDEARRILHQVSESERAAGAAGVVRDRRDGEGRRRAVRLVLRQGRGGRRGALAAQGGRVDLRARDARRVGIRAGREGTGLTRDSRENGCQTRGV